MHFIEFDFVVKYIKVFFDTQADAHSCLFSLEETGVPVDVDIYIYLLNSAPVSSGLDVSVEVDKLLAATIDTASLFVPTTLEELKLNQNSDNFCHSLNARLCEREKIPFTLNDERLLLSSID